MQTASHEGLLRALAKHFDVQPASWVPADLGKPPLEVLRQRIVSLGLVPRIVRVSAWRAESPLILVEKSGGGEETLGILLPRPGVEGGWWHLPSDGPGEDLPTGRRPWRSLSSWIRTRGFSPYGIAVQAPSGMANAKDLDQDSRADRAKSWFRDALWKSRREFVFMVAASTVINAFALAMPLFIRNVYDRVVPNAAFDSLWVLAGAIAVIFLFEFLMRVVRGAMVDEAGKGIDAILARRIFRQTLEMELSQRPSSAGNFAGQTRGYESIREFLSSLTVVAFLDIPLSLLMFILIFHLAGVLGWVPLVASACAIGGVVTLQPFLARLARKSHEDRVHRQSLMTEVANGLESVKAVGAGPELSRRMDRIIDESAEVDLKTRRLTHLGSAGTTFCINMTTVAIIVWGTYLISRGDLTMGGLVAAVMIVGRGMAPLNQLSQILLRFQGVAAVLRGLSGVMSIANENEQVSLKCRLENPEITLVNACFQYPNQPVFALFGLTATFSPGEKIGILGQAGSGKTTLLRMINRQLVATQGLVLFDGIDVSQLAPDSVRSACGYCPQDGSLFFGTLKENIALGAHAYSDEEIVAAAKAAGVLAWANRHPKGLEREIGERGVLLSGGQRQTIMLARTFLRESDWLLLDEPTAFLDLASEQQFVGTMEERARRRPGSGLLLATHKISLLRLVDRIIVMNEGRIVRDGAREEVLSELSGSKAPEPAS